MPDRFWLTKIKALVRYLNLEQIRRNSIDDRTESYLNNLILIVNGPSEEINNHIDTAHQITDASDRALLRLAQIEPQLANQEAVKVKVSHLLSGACLRLDISYSEYQNLKTNSPTRNSESPHDSNPLDYQQLFWWLWRCLPEIASNQLAQPSAILLPAAKILPDASIWSHNSLAAAIAGCLVGYQRPNAEPVKQPSVPHIATFSFSPIQELIKASRKMRDFWAGSWVLHYLSAKICWQLAWKYGPDSLIYPSLYRQPLIDHWILQSWDNFSNWLNLEEESEATQRALLTAGFPNVIVILLPEAEVEAAMNTARTTLFKEWLKIGELVFEELSHKPKKRHWTRELDIDNPTWKQWLKNQWQTYWTALPISPDGDFTISIAESDKDFSDWQEKLNEFGNLSDDFTLFKPEENDFIAAVQRQKSDTTTTVNVGSWWPYIFDQLRFAADSVKSSRSWRVPTAFIARSTISGIGPAVYPVKDFREWEKHNQPDDNNQLRPYDRHITEGDISRFWDQHAGLFDGSEKLNATEVLKRTLHHVLTRLLYPQEEEKWKERWSGYYPDLSSGVAGWLRTSHDTHPEKIAYFQQACQEINSIVEGWNIEKSENDFFPAEQPWGIPWVDETQNKQNRLPNPRLLNAGWLIEDFEPTSEDPEVKKREKQKELEKLQNAIAKYFKPGKNPTDWYVIAVGDGDGMGKWLKGERLDHYQRYIPSIPSIPSNANQDTVAVYEAFEQLTQIPKRMGPSTHNALSRALLDFSNQLVPYLTEQRYAGRLIYGGGDDVLAYTNFWEWDSWLWDIHECFRGAEDPQKKVEGKDDEFKNEGDYWQWQGNSLQNAYGQDWEPRLQKRPLFTMGSKASVSFGVVIAHHSVPLAIALENLWQAESSAKEYEHGEKKKDAVQVRVLYGSGNILQATSRFKVFKKWRKLIHNQIAQECSIFEKAAQWWSQHPAPTEDAIEDWTRYFCKSLDVIKSNQNECKEFDKILRKFLKAIYKSTPEAKLDQEIQSWLKLTAFVLRDRIIECNQEGES